MSTYRRAKIVTDCRSPIISMATSVKRETAAAFEKIAHAQEKTKAQLMRELIEREVHATSE